MFIEVSAEMFIGSDPSIVLLAGPVTVQRDYRQCLAVILSWALILRPEDDQLNVHTLYKDPPNNRKVSETDETKV